MSSGSYQKVIYDWNDTDKDYPKSKTIHELFEKQVLKSPENIALIFKDKKLTYKELNNKSNQLARYISKKYKAITDQDIQADTLIPLCQDRGFDMIIAILAVMKAGGTYIPMEPSNPVERLKHIIDDTNAKLVLTQDHLKNKINNIVDVLCIDNYELYQGEETSNLGVTSKSSDLAYVIYTSGTTGKPKGVMVEHSQVVQLLSSEKLSMNCQCSTLWSSYSFDVSVFEIFININTGSTLHILDDETRLLPNDFIEYIKLHNIDFCYIPPFYLNDFNKYLQYNQINSLKIVFTGVDSIYANSISNIYNKIKVINAYGPSETTVCCISTKINRSYEGILPIGSALENQKAYVLNKDLQPLPIGVIGELYVAGAGLSRGYLNQPELTAERFIHNHFATKKDIENGYTRLYKTGDLVKWLPDGKIQYVGRNDFQVKINGQRIELGEIESQLNSIDGIKHAAVAVKENNDIKYLVGYYLLEKPNSLKQDYILDFLSRELPSHMVPTKLLELDVLPLTSNGKLDRTALPDVNLLSDNYVAPRSNTEKTVCSIICDILNIEPNQVSMQDNFFNIGGNSLLAIKLAHKLSDKFNKQINVADMFSFNSIKKLAGHVISDPECIYVNNNTMSNNHEIAIIGTSGVFTNTDGTDQLWEILKANKEAYKYLSLEECKHLGVLDELTNNDNYIPINGNINGIKEFDYNFWSISKTEASQLDPQIRKFIEQCWYVLEKSGYVLNRENSNIGVFAGMGNSTYLQKNTNLSENDIQQSMINFSFDNSKDSLATITSYLLGLTGPSQSVNTACSTGLVSIIDACRNLSLNTCDIALAGGVSLVLPEDTGYIYKEGMILSKAGRCSPFDACSDGTVVGSSASVVLLKRLDDAVKDGDNILGVIKGYATNNDGNRKSSYSSPSVLGQSECIIKAQQMSGIDINDIDYIECHGTATKVGDPIELQALNKAFSHNGYHNKNKKVLLGSIKANIGHTDTAAGTSGLIKIIEMYRHNTIPAQPNFSEANSYLDIENTPFNISDKNREWIANKPRYAGVSSFGIGGTNAHIILCDYHSNQESVADLETTEYIIPLSAKSEISLDKFKILLANYLETNSVSLKDLAYTLSFRRQHFEYRSYIIAKTIDDTINQLKGSYSDTIQSKSLINVANMWLNNEDVILNRNTVNNANLLYELPCYQFDYEECWEVKYSNDSSLLKLRQSLLSCDGVDKNTVLNMIDQFITKKHTPKSICIKEKNVTSKTLTIAIEIAKTLGLDELSIHDDFFYIGGNSLLALDLLERLKSKDIIINLDDLSTHGSAHKISNLKQNNNEVLVPLKINDGKENVYLIHAAGGTVNFYKPIVQELDNRYDYYGIRNINMYGDILTQASSLDELASVYTKTIINHSSEEYIIGGASMGGVLAYEMAKQLKQNGYKTKFIFMIDSWAYYSDIFHSRDFFIDSMKKYIMKEISKEIDINRMLDSQWILMQLLLKHKLSKSVDLHILLFKAAELYEEYRLIDKSEYCYWDEYVEINKISTKVIPGTHYSIMSKGKIDIINELNKWLK